MARDVEQLVLTMSADIRRMEKALDRANGKFDKTAREIEKRQRTLDKKLEQLGAGAGEALGRLSATAAVAFGAIVGYSIKAAAEATELKDAFRIAFGEGSKGAEAYAKTLSDKVGRSQLEIMESMTKFRLLLKDQDAATAQSITEALQARAIDVGSLFNLKDAEVVQKFFSGLSGEAEPLKALGVNLNEAAMKAELLRLGFKGSASEASEQAKQVARANIILRETAVAAGNASDTIDSTANRFKKLQGETRDAAAAFGEQFLPIANQVLQWATDALTAFNNLPSGVQGAGLALLALAAASGPIAATIVGLRNLIKTAVAARAALVALAATTPAAGGAAAGGGLAAGGAGLLGAGAGLVTGFGIASASDDINGVIARRLTRDKTLKTQMDQLAASDRDIERALHWFTTSGRNRGANLDKIATLQALQASRAKAAATPYLPSVALPKLDSTAGFGLSGDMLKPVSGNGGKGRAGAKARETEMERDIKAFWERLSAGNSESYKLFLDKFEKSILDEPDNMVSLVDGAVDADASFKASVDEQAAYVQESWASAIEGGIWAAMREGVPGIAEYFAQNLTQSLVESLSDNLAQFLTSKGGSSGGGFLGSLLSVFTGPRHAAGTNYAPGGMSLVGENGPEIVNMPRGAQVIPSHAVRAMANMRPSAASSVYSPVFHLHAEGAVMTDQLMATFDAKAKRYAAQAYSGAVQTSRKGFAATSQRQSLLGTS